MGRCFPLLINFVPFEGLEMCLKYNVDGEDLVDQWFAYTSSVLRGAAPSVEYLERMERKEFMKNKDQEVKRPVYFEDQGDVIQYPLQVIFSV